jgi:hypothetical protein
MSSQLNGSAKLWRYLSLDKLIDLLSTGQLFFVPLSRFVNTDPFEGYLPAVAIETDAAIYKSVISHLESLVTALDDHFKRTNQDLTEDERKTSQHKLEEIKVAPKCFFEAIMRCITISCWHANNDESEAMWRLYSDNGKAVAIETSAEALKISIQSGESEHRVHIYPVKYLDFFNKDLKPTDCVVGGHRVPLLKRRSYQHENEVRAFIGRAPQNLEESRNIEYWQPTPIRLPVDVKGLVKRVHVSPYSTEPFASSVIKVCELFGLGPEVVEPSKLLLGTEELMKPFNF